MEKGVMEGRGESRYAVEREAEWVEKDWANEELIVGWFITPEISTRRNYESSYCATTERKQIDMMIVEEA